MTEPYPRRKRRKRASTDFIEESDDNMYFRALREAASMNPLEEDFNATGDSASDLQYGSEEIEGASDDLLEEDPDLDEESDDERLHEAMIATSLSGYLQSARERSNESDLPLESNIEALGVSSADHAAHVLWLSRESNPNCESVAAETSRRRFALLVEDDGFTAQEYGQALTQCGYRVVYALSADQALKTLDLYADLIDLIVLDIRMPAGDLFSEFESVGGRKTGVLLAQEFLDRASGATILALSNSTDALDIAWFEGRETCHFCAKRDYPPDAFASFVKSSVMQDISNIKCFIVHGHDRVAALELKNYLQNRIGFPEPVILAEKPSKGMTIIEKLERYLGEADYVFALFTPDDFIVTPKRTSRARQNVVFEFGYVLGLLGRTSGRVFFLHKGDVEIPSDLSGMVYIDVSNGIESASEDIRRELEPLLRGLA